MDIKLYIFILKQAPHGLGGATYGTTFDLRNACDICGTGAKQIGPLLLKSSAIPKNKDIIETLDHELLISQKIKNMLENNTIKGVKYLSVLNYRDKKPLEYVQLEPQFTLPQLSMESKGIITEHQCAKCKRDGFFDTVKSDQQYIYATVDKSLLAQSDIFNTWEHFGNSNLVEDPPNPPGVFKPRKVIHFAKPRIIVNDKVKQLLEKTIKRVAFIPVTIKSII